METRDLCQQVIAVLDRVDLLQLFRQRGRFARIHLVLVHSAGIEVAYLLQFRRGLRIGVRVRGLVANLVQRVVVLLGQLVEGTPAPNRGRNRFPLNQAAVGIEIEILGRT